MNSTIRGSRGGRSTCPANDLAFTGAPPLGASGATPGRHQPGARRPRSRASRSANTTLSSRPVLVWPSAARRDSRCECLSSGATRIGPVEEDLLALRLRYRMPFPVLLCVAPVPVEPGALGQVVGTGRPTESKWTTHDILDMHTVSEFVGWAFSLRAGIRAGLRPRAQQTRLPTHPSPDRVPICEMR